MGSTGAVHVGPVPVGELELLAEIGRRTFVETFAADNDPHEFAAYVNRAFSIDRLREEYLVEGSTFYFARIGEKPCGYLKLNRGRAQTERVAGETLEIERIYVDHGYQGAGVGKAMFEFALDIARNQALDAVWLGVWERNPKAIRFYERQGFVAFGEHNFTIGSDVQRDIMMRFDLR